MVAYNNKKYYIDIIESKPSHAITIIETDCEVDFAPPLDYKEPERPVPSLPSSKAPAEGLNFKFLYIFGSKYMYLFAGFCYYKLMRSELTWIFSLSMCNVTHAIFLS